MNRFKLGVVLESLGLPVRAALPEAARAAAPGVQFDAAGELAPDALGDTGRREFRTLLRSYNLDAAAVACPLRHGLDTFEHQQPRLDHVKKAMRLAADLGARKLVVPLPKLPADDPPADPGAEPAPKPLFNFNAKPPRAVTLRESLTDLGRHGDKLGVLVCLEGGADPGATLADYLKTFDSGSLRVTFDPANFLTNGHDPLAGLMALAGSVAHAHGRDARTASAAAGPTEVPLGAGDVDWLALAAGLAAVEFDGYVCVERTAGQDHRADVAAGVKFLRRFAPAG